MCKINNRLFWVICAATSLMQAQAAMVAQYTFDNETLENTGSSGSAHNGTVYAGSSATTAVYSQNTSSGSGRSLNLTAANRYLRINNSASGDGGYLNTFDFGAGQSFSYSFLMNRPAGISGWQSWSEYANKNQDNTDGWKIRDRNLSYSSSSDGLRLRYNNEQRGLTVGQHGNMLCDGDWHQVAFTFDAGTDTLVFYVDGVAIGTENNSIISSSSSAALIFGGRAGTDARTSEILVDEIKVFSTALSSTEIAALVPEPASIGLMVISSAGMLCVRRFMRV